MIDFIVQVAAGLAVVGISGLLSWVWWKRTQVTLAQSRMPTIKWIDVTGQPGPMRRVLRVRFIALAWIVAFGTVALDTSPINSSQFEPRPVEFFRNEADDILLEARWEAQDIIREAEGEADDILQQGEEDAHRVREFGVPDQEKAQRLVARAGERARRVVERGRDEATQIMKYAEQKLESLRAEEEKEFAEQAGFWNRLIKAVWSFPKYMLRGAMVLGFLGILAAAWGWRGSTISAFLGSMLIVTILSVMRSTEAPGTVAVVNLIEPLLLASALFASREFSISVPEILLNAPYILYQRFGYAISLAAVVTLITALTRFAVVALAYVADEETGSAIVGDGKNIQENLPFVVGYLAGHLAVAVLFSFVDVFVILSGASLLSVLLEPRSTVTSGPESKPGPGDKFDGAGEP